MKKNLILAGIALLFAACSNDTETGGDSRVAPVRVQVSGYSVSQGDFPETRGVESAVDYTSINAITLAFYKSDGTQAYKHEQLRDDNTTYTTFGSFELSLPMGSYTMVALAYKTKAGSPLVLTSPTAAAFTGEHGYETFAYTQAVNITNTSTVDLSATLSRIISRLTVCSSDGRTANISNVRMTLSAGGWSFNPTTGLATVNTGCTNTVSIAAATGESTISSTNVFLLTDEQTMNVTIETLDSEGNTLFTKTVTDVPFKRNRVTILTGKMYTNDDMSGTFNIETAWLPDTNMDF